MNNDLPYQIALTLIPNIGTATLQNLVTYCGSAEQVFSTSKAKLLKVPNVGEERARSIIESKNIVLDIAEEELKFISDYNIQALFYTSPNYPKRLKECTDMPAILYYKGTADLNATKVLGIVGTRNITEYGKEIVKKIMEDLHGSNILIVSGLAYGVDVNAHKYSLETGLKTLGVLGHGLNQIYPKTHRSIAKRMLEQGGLLTEYTSIDKFHHSNFPERNRIIAGMCDAVAVVESATKGGAVITAHIANSYNRDVFAVPGKIDVKYSAGCNFLIKTFKAQLIENGKDILDAMLWDTENASTCPAIKSMKKKTEQKKLAIPLSESEQKIYNLLHENHELEIDKLASLCSLNTSILANTLLEMEMNELLISLPGKRYKLAR